MIVYESAFAVTLHGDLAAARQLSHDTVIRNSGRARRSGVAWSYFSADNAQAHITEDGSDIVLPADAVLLCEALPDETLVVATVQVDPTVAP